MRSPQARPRRASISSAGRSLLRGLFGRRRGVAVAPTPVDTTAVERALSEARSQHGETLAALAQRRPRLVVCLRHLGCTFCREALAQLARERRRIEEAGTGIVLVHLARDDQRAARLFAHYKLHTVARISDPDRVLYAALGLDRGGISELVGPRVLVRTFTAACRGHLPGRISEDLRQMPGVFLIHRGRIVREFRHRHSADRPDYLALAAAASGETAP